VKNVLIAHYRPHPSPLLPLPLNVRSSGDYILRAGSETRRGPGAFIQIFWTVDGEGSAQVGRRWLPLPPRSLFLYHPGEPHWLRAEGGKDWHYRWFTLDGPNATAVTDLFGLQRVQPVPSCPATLFSQLHDCLRVASSHGEQRASLIAYRIFLLASSSRLPVISAAQQNVARPLRQALDERFCEAALNISLLSREFHIHRSTLYRIFVRQYGTSPIQYLSWVRLRHALRQLKETSLPVGQIALQSGFADLNYFCKLVKKTTGQTPGQLR
jgi:AraC-like DNA-binding protein